MPRIRDRLAGIPADGCRVLRKHLIGDKHDRKGLSLDLYRTGARQGDWGRTSSRCWMLTRTPVAK